MHKTTEVLTKSNRFCMYADRGIKWKTKIENTSQGYNGQAQSFIGKPAATVFFIQATKLAGIIFLRTTNPQNG